MEIKTCPDCEKPTTNGEICFRCERHIQDEMLEAEIFLEEMPRGYFQTIERGA